MIYGDTNEVRYVYEEYKKGIFVRIFYDEQNIAIKNFRKRVVPSQYTTREFLERI